MNREGTMSVAEHLHDRPHPLDPMAAPTLEFDLAREIAQLHEETAWRSGQNAKTLVKESDLRIVLMLLRAGHTIAAHRTDGRIAIQVISGRVRVRVEGERFELATGRLLAVESALEHDVEAVEESALLLTVAWPGHKRG